MALGPRSTRSSPIRPRRLSTLNSAGRRSTGVPDVEEDGGIARVVREQPLQPVHQPVGQGVEGEGDA